MNADLQGKVAYVTGAAAGIGAAIAGIYASHGASVVVADIDRARGELTAAAICAAGGRALFVYHDVTSEAQWEAGLGLAVDQFHGLDIVVNNAGIEQTCLLADVELADIEKLMAVNVTGLVLGHKHAIRIMRPGGAAGRGGSIINLSSVAGLIGTPALGVYSASKGAARLLTKAAAVECGRLGYGIRVNSIHPGLIDTAMGNKLVDDFIALGFFADRVSAQQQMLAAYPSGRTGVPDDVAGAALFLASDHSSWITGNEIVVDGGMTIS